MRSALIAAVVAALVSSVGTFAASRYVITSQSQIAPGVRHALRGPRGEQGPTGAPSLPLLANPGPTGATGVQGKEGRQGNTGPQGYTGPTGPEGPRGALQGELTNKELVEDIEKVTLLMKQEGRL